MKTAVIYARFSCDKQRDESIEDQLRVCHEYAKREGYRVVKEYPDRAISGRTDARPQFQLMVSEAPISDVVIVYQMERFSRGRYDPSIYKSQLEKKGVRVVSATEYIPETPEGVLIEKLLEGQAAYFSLDLSRKTKRGMEGNAMQAKSNGDCIYGYVVDPITKKYVIHEERSEIVRESFRRYLDGENMTSIARVLAERGVRTYKGNKPGYSFVHRMLNDERYTGVYIWGNYRIEGGMPQIISESDFRGVKRVVRNKDRSKENWDDYALTGKLFCGLCDNPMRGTSGISHTGTKYRYYECPKCDRKLIRVESLEGKVSEAVVNIMSDEDNARKVARMIMEHAGSDNDDTMIKATQQRLRDVKSSQRNILAAIEQGVIPSGAKDRIKELAEQEESITIEIERLKARRVMLDEDDLVRFLSMSSEMDDQKLLLSAFVNKVFMFENYAVVTMNYHDTETELSEVEIALEGSDNIHLVPLTGFEPAAFCSGGRRSIP